MRKGCLAQTGRSEQENMLERFAAFLCGFDKDREVFDDRLLANEFADALGSQRYFIYFFALQEPVRGHSWHVMSSRRA